MPECSTTGLSIRAFAKRDGCTHTTVRRAIKDGKLPILADGSIDPRHVGGDWRRENRRAESGTSGGTSGGTCSTKRSTKSATAVAAEPSIRETHDQLFAEEANAFIDDVLAGRFRPIGDAERIKENALAAKHLLAARQASDSVVDLQEAQDQLFTAMRDQRDAWLNWPSRVAPLIAATLNIDAEKLRYELDEHVHAHLTDLSGVELDFGKEGLKA